jgi:hypothetical protein
MSHEFVAILIGFKRRHYDLVLAGFDVLRTVTALMKVQCMRERLTSRSQGLSADALTLIACSPHARKWLHRWFPIRLSR